MNKLTDVLHIPDTQSAPDARHLAIQRVGVKDVRYPLALRVAGDVQTTAALWTLDVALPAEKKGTHMSRFVAWLDELATAGVALDAAELRARHAEMLRRLGATEGRIEAAFSFFVRKRAPVSGLQSLLDYQGRWISETRAGATRVWAEVAVPVKSLCPCSKEISDYGAHNQRSLVTIRVELREAGAPDDGGLPWEQLVRFAEDAAPSEIWPMLKRPDEKWVTERAYENPKFVEDLVRDVALALNADARIGAYSVDVENFESIHNHSAYARIERAQRACVAQPNAALRQRIAELRDIQRFYDSSAGKTSMTVMQDDMPRLMAPMMQGMQARAPMIKERLDAASQQLKNEGINLQQP